MKKTTLRKTFLLITLAMVPLAMSRTVAKATVVTLDSSEDAEIDSHVNSASAFLGNDPSLIIEQRDVNVWGVDINGDAIQSNALIKWDVSSIPANDVVTSVTLQLSGEDSADAAIDVFAIDVGDWAEASVSWDSWAATTKNLVLLGQLTSAGPAHLGSNPQTTFNDSDLTAWVQDWVDGDRVNYGLILKMTGTALQDVFSANDTTFSPTTNFAPRLIINHEAVPEPTTAMLLLGGIGSLFIGRWSCRNLLN